MVIDKGLVRLCGIVYIIEGGTEMQGKFKVLGKKVSEKGTTYVTVGDVERYMQYQVVLDREVEIGEVIDVTVDVVTERVLLRGYVNGK